MDCRRYLTPVVAVALTVRSLLGPPRAAANQVLAVESEGFRADAGHGLIIWSSGLAQPQTSLTATPERAGSYCRLVVATSRPAAR
jgi:hypothetical protein